ncbi:MAG: hypothetical protein KBC78_02470 [Candidatus Pacebacteria bacterium]|nr:hypothetical protein [Candidatus Paceibacterota bacterium]
MKKNNLLLSILVIVFITGCSTTHIKDENGELLMSIHSGKTTDFIDWTHGGYVAVMHERDENGQPTGRVAHDYQVKTQRPLFGMFVLGVSNGAGAAAIFAGTGGMGCRNGRCGGGGSSTPMVINNDNSNETNAGAQSFSGARADVDSDINTAVTNR